MIQNLIFGVFFFFWEYYFWHISSLYLSTHFSGHHQIFLILDFLGESLKASKKSFRLCKFSKNMFLFRIRKDICTTPFLDAHKLYSQSLLKANVRIFMNISGRKFFSKDVVRFYLIEDVFGRRLNSFNKAVCCLGVAKCFTIFHFNWNL